MALPSARRPLFVEEELAVECKKVLKCKVNKVDVFMAQMGAWYDDDLQEAEKMRLTPTKLKRQALIFLKQLRYVYEHLPKDWLTNFIKKHNVRLFRKKKATKFYSDAMMLSVTQDPLSVLPAKRGSNVLKPSLGVDEVDCNRVKEEGEEMADMDEGDEAVKGIVPSKRPKKFVDLTDRSPPKEWLAKLSEGVALPRELRIYSTRDLNILYFDYSPEYEDDIGTKYEQRVHDGNGFKWWENEVVGDADEAIDLNF